MGRQFFATCLPNLAPSSTRGKARAFDQHAEWVSAMDRHYQHQGPWEAVTLGAWHDGMWPQEPMHT
jgi:hypothetical protein